MFEVSQYQTWYTCEHTHLASLTTLQAQYLFEIAKTGFVFLIVSHYEGYWISPKFSASVLWLWVAFGLAVCPGLHTLPPKFGWYSNLYVSGQHLPGTNFGGVIFWTKMLAGANMFWREHTKQEPTNKFCSDTEREWFFCNRKYTANTQAQWDIEWKDFANRTLCCSRSVLELVCVCVCVYYFLISKYITLIWSLNNTIL